MNRDVMVETAFSVNLPVHLARRDAYYEKAAELIYRAGEIMDLDPRRELLSRVSHLLETARFHAEMVILADQSSPADRDFLAFLQLLCRNARAILFMIEHESELDADEGFLCRFLLATPEQCELPALHYRRRADDLMHGLIHLLRLAHEPFWRQQQAVRDQEDAEAAQRYTQARESFQRELMEQTLPIDNPAGELSPTS